MKPIASLFISIAALTAQSEAHAAASMLRIACEGDAVRAEVSINGVFKGECPIDVQVNPGTVQVQVVKKIDAAHEHVFNDEFRIGEGAVKKVEVILSAPRLNAEEQRRYDARMRIEQAEAKKREAARQAELAETTRQRKEQIDAALTVARQQGAEVGNGKPFRDCPDCPAMVLAAKPGADPVAIGQYEVTRGEFATFVNDTKRDMSSSCSVFVGGWFSNILKLWQEKADANWQSPGFEQTDNHPVVCVSHVDAQDYAKWLSAKTGHLYKLPKDSWWVVPSEKRIFGDWPWESQRSACQYANVLDESGDGVVSVGLGKAFRCNDHYAYTAPVGSFRPNSLGIYDAFGNVQEWAGEWRPKDVTAPGGSSWASSVDLFGVVHYGTRFQDVGFRVMRYMAPFQANQ
jgi:formylglycine-generating enzyme required for sulfatase activity